MPPKRKLSELDNEQLAARASARPRTSTRPMPTLTPAPKAPPPARARTGSPPQRRSTRLSLKHVRGHGMGLYPATVSEETDGKAKAKSSPPPNHGAMSMPQSRELSKEMAIGEEGVKQAVRELVKMEQRLMAAVQGQQAALERSRVTVRPDYESEHMFKPGLSKALDKALNSPGRRTSTQSPRERKEDKGDLIQKDDAEVESEEKQAEKAPTKSRLSRAGGDP